MSKFVRGLALLIGLVCSLQLYHNAYATVPVTFSNGTIADANDVNTNFNYFENKFSTSSGHNHDGSNSKLITKTGTITSGTWTASPIGATYGGTGNDNSAAPQGSIFYASSTGNFVTLNPGTAGQFLTSQGTFANPTWSGGLSDVIVRGFELVYSSATVINVNPGTMYIGAIAISKTAVTSIDITQNGSYISGSSERGASKLIYVYAKNDGTLILSSNEPTKADTSGNTAGTLLYYTTGGVYYRVLGAIRLDGSQNILKFYQSGKKIIYDDVYNNAELLILNAGNQTNFTAVDCSSLIPLGATLVDFEVSVGTVDLQFNFRPTGSSATAGLFFSLPTYGVINDLTMNSARSIDYKVASSTMSLWVAGYTLNIR